MTKQEKATLSLMIALFLNPMGFDIVQYVLISLTGSLFGANFVLYCLAVLFFGLYFYYSSKNPITVFKNLSSRTFQSIVKFINK